MGPRSDERGNRFDALLKETTRAPASMGPRSDERGNELDGVVICGTRSGFNGAALR